MGLTEVLDPTMEAPKVKRKLAPLLDDVHGKSVGFRILWGRFDVFMVRFEELLREHYNIAEVVKYYGEMGDLTGAKTQGVSEPLIGKRLDEAERRELIKRFYDKSRWAVLGMGG